MKVVDLLGIAGGGAQKGVPARDPLGGSGVAGNHLPRGKLDLRTGFEERRAELRVVEQLQVGLVTGEVGHFVADRERGRTQRGGEGAGQPQAGTEHDRLVHDPLDLDGARAAGVDRDADVVGGNVGDAAVQGHAVTGRAVGLQSTPAEPFVEPGQPADPPAVVHVDERRVHRVFDGRIPPQGESVAGPLPEPQAPGGQQRQAEPAVVDLDHIDPVRDAAAEGGFLNPTGGGTRAGDGHRELLQPDAGGAVGEGPGMLAHEGLPGEGWESGLRGGRCSRNGV